MYLGKRVKISILCDAELLCCILVLSCIFAASNSVENIYLYKFALFDSNRWSSGMAQLLSSEAERHDAETRKSHVQTVMGSPATSYQAVRTAVIVLLLVLTLNLASSQC